MRWAIVIFLIFPHFCQASEVKQDLRFLQEKEKKGCDLVSLMHDFSLSKTETVVFSVSAISLLCDDRAEDVETVSHTGFTVAFADGLEIDEIENLAADNFRLFNPDNASGQSITLVMASLSMPYYVLEKRCGLKMGRVNDDINDRATAFVAGFDYQLTSSELCGAMAWVLALSECSVSRSGNLYDVFCSEE